jgi:putative Mn2+ efflux pump MntP
MMRDPLQELRSGKDFFAARGETKGLWRRRRGEAQYTETHALAQGSTPDPNERFTTAPRLATQWAEICETADGGFDRMSWKIAAFVFPLGLDTLALAIALGLRGFRPWRPALIFSAFEGVMPLFGIALARLVSRRFETAAVVTGGIILVGLGIHSVQDARRGEKEKELERISFSSLRSFLPAGLAISTDELAIGFPLGASNLPIPVVLITIVCQTLLLAFLGVIAGNRVRAGLAQNASRYAGISAGIVFALVGLWLIVERVVPHLLRPFGSN